jgi:hypothetical protein
VSFKDFRRESTCSSPRSRFFRTAISTTTLSGLPHGVIGFSGNQDLVSLAGLFWSFVLTLVPALRTRQLEFGIAKEITSR